MLISDLKSNVEFQTMLPMVVKERLWKSFNGREHSAAEVVPRLNNWIVTSMPDIALHHEIRIDQSIDALQHYRFGFVQAMKLLSAGNSTMFDQDSNRDQLIALFTNVHDIGRMMTGSGATYEKYAAENEGAILHPIAGASILREAFVPLMKTASSEISGLLNALIYTAERHTRSVGLSAEKVNQFELWNISPHYEHNVSLWLKDAPIRSNFRKYAYLAAIADLINNIDHTLIGSFLYRSMVGLENMSPEERAMYVMRGPGNGDFQLEAPENTTLYVQRLWNESAPIDREHFSECLDLMRTQATRRVSGVYKNEAAAAFDEEIRTIFSLK